MGAFVGTDSDNLCWILVQYLVNSSRPIEANINCVNLTGSCAGSGALCVSRAAGQWTLAGSCVARSMTSKSDGAS